MIDRSTIFYCKTVQTNAIRVLFEALKNILSDINFKVDSNGIKLTTIDGTEKAIVNLFLDATKFEEYSCSRDINIGINLISMFKILKGIKNTDTISFVVYTDEEDHIYIITSHTDKKFTNISRIKLLDMDEKIYNIPDIDFDSYITMPSSDFQSYISELSVISEKITIITNSNELTLSANGNFAQQSIKIHETNTNNNTRSEQRGEFNTKFIQLFTKSTNLCATVEIYIKTDFPLTLVYNVANLGQLKYCLAPE